MWVNEQNHREWLESRADSVEQALASLSLPVRISGGQVRERSVRYHAVPLGTTELGAIEGVEPRVAEALGVESVKVSPEPGGLVIDIEGTPCGSVPLLPLLESVGDLRPLTSVVGLDPTGSPILLDLRRPATRHLAVVGSSSERRAELLRTVVVGLALSSRPSALQFVGVDPGGKQLCVVEALPHSLTDVAIRPEFAVEVLSWMADEVLRRSRTGVQQPHLVLVVDGVELLLRQAGQGVRHLLTRLAAHNGEAGVHLLIGLDGSKIPGLDGWLVPGRWAVAAAVAGAGAGLFRLSAGPEVVELMPACASADDLNKIVGGLAVAHRRRPSMGGRQADRESVRALAGGVSS